MTDKIQLQPNIVRYMLHINKIAQMSNKTNINQSRWSTDSWWAVLLTLILYYSRESKDKKENELFKLKFFYTALNKHISLIRPQ